MFDMSLKMQLDKKEIFVKLICNLKINLYAILAAFLCTAYM